LAKELGANPKTIQNALIRLEALGLVRRQSRSGTYVVPEAERQEVGRALYARLVTRSPVGPQGETDFWTSLMVYGFQREAQSRDTSMALEYSDSVEGVVAEAIAESESPACIGTCILAMPVETRHAIRLAASRANVILADWDIEEPLVPCLSFDNIGAGRLAAEHLVRLGHRRIVFIAAEPVSPSGRDRRRGAEQFLAENGLRMPVHVVPRGMVHETFEQVMSAPEPPTAIIAGSPGAAELVFELASSRGLGVPHRLSLITIVEPRSLQHRTLSIVSVDHEALGRRALGMLLDEELHAEPRRVLLPVRLVQGNTTAPPQ